jgi:hypothetical protein
MSAADLRNTFACDHARTGANKTTCIYRTEPDGAVVTGVLLAGKSGGRPYQVDVFRADDTVVRLVVSNTYYEGTPDPNATHKAGRQRATAHARSDHRRRAGHWADPLPVTPAEA